jgi:carbon storage regulator
MKEEPMLVLSRKRRDAIVIGNDVRVTVLSIGRDQVRLGVSAPPHVEVHREEVYRAIHGANRQAEASSAEADVGLVAKAPAKETSGAREGATVAEAGEEQDSAPTPPKDPAT